MVGTFTFFTGECMTTLRDVVRLICLHFHPIKGSTLQCEKCTSEKLVHDLGTIPKQCWNPKCGAEFSLSGKYPHGLWEQSQGLVQQGYGRLASAEA